MSETPSRPRPAEELPWMVSYLREDIQDLRSEIRGIYTHINEGDKTLRQHIDETTQGLRQHIDQVNIDLGQRIDQVNIDLGKRLDSRFALLLTTMIALAGILAALIRH